MLLGDLTNLVGAGTNGLAIFLQAKTGSRSRNGERAREGQPGDWMAKPRRRRG